MLSHPFRFILLNLAWFGLLLSHYAFFEYVENGFALDLKLSSQIIDSNIHPLSISSRYPLRDHNDLTVFALNLTTIVLLPALQPALPFPVLRCLHSPPALRH